MENDNELIEKYVADVSYFVKETLTLCSLKLKNGFLIIGESICANKKDYDISLGRIYALEKATNKLKSYVIFFEKEKQFFEKEFKYSLLEKFDMFFKEEMSKTENENIKVNLQNLKRKIKKELK